MGPTTGRAGPVASPILLNADCFLAECSPADWSGGGGRDKIAGLRPASAPTLRNLTA